MARRLGFGRVALCGLAIIALGACGGDSDGDSESDSESFDSPADGEDETSSDSDAGSEDESSSDSDAEDDEESASAPTPQEVADCLDAEGAFIGTVEDDIEEPSASAPAGLVGVVETFNGDPGSPPAVAVRFFDTQESADAHFAEQTGNGFDSVQGGTVVATPTAGQPDLTEEDLEPVGDCIGA